MTDALLASLMLGAASYRLWRLIAEDEITQHYRDQVLVRSPAWVDAMMSCPWCLGTHIALIATWITDLTIGLRVPVLVALAAAVVVGALGSWLD